MVCVFIVHVGSRGLCIYYSITCFVYLL